jgi:hypothetical protein
MKSIFLLFAIACFVLGCQRSLDFPAGRITDCRISKIVQGLNNDTSFFFHYDAQGRIDSIVQVDSFMGNYSRTPMVPTYDGAGRVSSIENGFHDITIDYNSAGQPLVVIGGGYRGANQTFAHKFEYEYGAGNLPTRRTEYLFNSSNSQWERWKVKDYEFSNGDIIRTRTRQVGQAFDSTKVLTIDFSYYPLPNVFKSLSFYAEPTFGNRFYAFSGMDAFFNQHLFKSSSGTASQGESIYENTIQFDSTGQQPVSIKSLRDPAVPNDLFSLFFYYDCP